VGGDYVSAIASHHNNKDIVWMYKLWHWKHIKLSGRY